MLSTVLAGGPRRAAQPPRTPVHRRAVALMQQQEQDFRVDVRRTASEMKQLLHDSENACNTVELAISTEQLERILMHQLYAPAGSRPKYVFFDVDECLVMPATPFIDGLPGSDALVRKLVLCGETVHAALRRKMIEAYYSAPLTLVDAGLPRLIADLRGRGVSVHGLTSRGSSSSHFPFAWHNAQVVEALERHRVCFSPLADEFCGEHGDNTKAGGILYAGGEQMNKAVLMQKVTRGAPSTLVDNSETKLFKATSLGRACVHGVHFTRAWAREASDAERRRWITTQRLSAPGQPKEQDFGI